MIPNPLKLLILLPVLLLLEGCLGGSSPAVRFYVLSPVDSQPVVTSEKQPMSIQISTVHLPQYLDRPHLVTRSGDNRLNILQSHQWGGNLRKDLMRTLAINLSRLLNTPDVTIAAHRSASQGDYRVSIEILKFEKDSDNHVKLTAQWQITGGIERKPLTTRITQLSSDTPAAEGNYDEVVAMMSNEFGQMAQQIAEAIHELEQKN